MLRRGLVEGTAGNISARREDGNLVITPSSVDYADMTLDDLVVVDPDGAVLQAAEGRSPSTEMKLHLACYRAFDDIGSVIHSHPVWATMFAIAHQPIPACIDEFAIYCGGDIRCSEYAASATPEVGTQRGEGTGGSGRGADRQPRHGGGRAASRTKCCTSPRSSSGPPKSSGGQGLSADRSRYPTTSTPTSPASTATSRQPDVVTWRHAVGAAE